MNKKDDPTAKNLLTRVLTKIPFIRPRGKGKPAELPAPARIYTPVRNFEVLEDSFNQLLAFLQKELIAPFGLNPKDYALWPKFFTQRGRTAQGYPFLYIKAQNSRGWLLEATDTGWVVARSEHIVHLDLFLRSYEPWDIATLVEAQRFGRVSYRIRSEHLSEGTEQVFTPLIYQRKLFAALAEESLRLPL